MALRSSCATVAKKAFDGTAGALARGLAGSFAMLSPSHAYLYVLFGASRLPSDIFGETACRTLQVGLFRANGSASVETITVFRTGTGELRLRIPITRAMAISTIGLPLGRLARDGSDLDGWVRLVRAYAVLGEPERARGAAAGARRALAEDPDKLRRLDAAVTDVAPDASLAGVEGRR